jgi:hypothetical protein
MFDKPVAHDQRRANYVTPHLGFHDVSGIPVASIITPSHRSGSGDASVGPCLIAEAADHLYTCGGHLTGGIGDGTQDTTDCYTRFRAYGGPWFAPPSQKTRRGLHPDRDRHIDDAPGSATDASTRPATTRGHVPKPYLERCDHREALLESINARTAKSRTRPASTRLHPASRQHTSADPADGTLLRKNRNPVYATQPIRVSVPGRR